MAQSNSEGPRFSGSPVAGWYTTQPPVQVQVLKPLAPSISTALPLNRTAASKTQQLGGEHQLLMQNTELNHLDHLWITCH